MVRRTKNASDRALVELRAFGLPRSNAVALMRPSASPTGYGLGRSGWVTAQFAAGEAPPVELLKEWIDESSRAQAPKKLVAQLPERGAEGEGESEGGGPVRRSRKAR
ncbi:MAG: hypothetical protein IT371_11925 [Deltaproteobacteria bacterium]|nr:hypothetical protein [Deltaproteobacteria bacterium]